MPPADSRVLRYTFFVRRHPDISDEEFHSYWSTKHSGVAARWIQKHPGILKYTQHHVTPETRAMAADGVASAAWGANLLDYDGCVELVVRTPADLQRAMEDPEYTEVVAKDDAYFVDQSKPIDVMLGYDEVYLLDGKLVEQGQE